MLNWLVDVTVNKPNGENPLHVDPRIKLPTVDLLTPPPAGSRQRLLELGPAGFAADLRAQKALAVTDTTFRDAHQSLLATRVRTKDLLAVAPHVARMTPQLLSVEAWGGATYDVALRFLGEDPWERLEKLREALPNIAIQMLLRGRNTVGYTPYPTEVTDAFVREAAATGVDIFRVFDALNDVSQMRPAIDAVLETGTAVAEVAVCYTGDLLNPAEDLYTLDYYLRLGEQIVDAGAHVLAIKDMAGLLRPGRGIRPRLGVPRPVRRSGARAHARHPGRPARHPARRFGGGGGCRRRGRRADVGHHQPAVAVVARRRPLAHRARHGPRPRRGVGPRAVLGGRAAPVPAVRVRAAGPDGPRVPPRDPRRSALEPAPAGDRARAVGGLRADRGHVRRRERHPRARAQGDAVVQGRRRPRPAPRGRQGRPGRLRGEPRQVRRAGLGRRLHGRRARRPAGRMARAVPHQGARRAATSRSASLR